MKLNTLILLSLIFTSSVLSQEKPVVDTLSLDDFEMTSIVLPKELVEISALEYDYDKENNFFWGLNDSGNKTEIYKFNPKNGEIEQTVHITNAKNIDWEELTSDEKYFYIGDFGNNLGKRKDLSVYCVEKSKIDAEKVYQEVEAEKIEFYYPEQDNFNFPNLTTNFDMEAMFYYQDKIHLFTKEWTDYKTTHYTIDPKIKEKQAAKKIEKFQINYAVTAAYIDSISDSFTKGIYLLGYTKSGFAFLSIFELPENNSYSFFSENLRKISLSLGFTTQIGQVEGVSILYEKEGENQICVSGEEFKFKSFYIPQSLHCLKSIK